MYLRLPQSGLRWSRTEALYTTDDLNVWLYLSHGKKYSFVRNSPQPLQKSSSVKLWSSQSTLDQMISILSILYLAAIPGVSVSHWIWITPETVTTPAVLSTITSLSLSSFSHHKWPLKSELAPNLQQKEIHFFTQLYRQSNQYTSFNQRVILVTAPLWLSLTVYWGWVCEGVWEDQRNSEFLVYGAFLCVVNWCNKMNAPVNLTCATSGGWAAISYCQSQYLYLHCLLLILRGQRCHRLSALHRPHVWMLCPKLSVLVTQHAALPCLTPSSLMPCESCKLISAAEIKQYKSSDPVDLKRYRSLLSSFSSSIRAGKAALSSDKFSRITHRDRFLPSKPPSTTFPGYRLSADIFACLSLYRKGGGPQQPSLWTSLPQLRVHHSPCSALSLRIWPSLSPPGNVPSLPLLPLSLTVRYKNPWLVADLHVGWNPYLLYQSPPIHVSHHHSHKCFTGFDNSSSSVHIESFHSALLKLRTTGESLLIAFKKNHIFQSCLMSSCHGMTFMIINVYALRILWTYQQPETTHPSCTTAMLMTPRYKCHFQQMTQQSTMGISACFADIHMD